MDNIRKFIAAVSLIILSAAAVKGQDRYAIHYKFKPQATYTLDDPSTFLSEKALDRRERNQVALDSTDLPVAQKYIDAVRDIVINIQYNSKWMNASIVVATDEQIAAIKQLSFVKEDGIELVAKGFYTDNKTPGTNILNYPVNIRILSKTKDEEDYAFQNNLLGMPDMHAEGLTGKGVTIAVFDGGFLNTDKIEGMKHLFDNNQIIATRDFVTPWSENVFRTETHGTAALSLIAANDVNTLVAGAYDANYVLCITEDVASEYRIEEYNWVRAAEYADSLGVDIINSSLGYVSFTDPSMNYEKSDLDGKTAVITQGAFMAGERGILVVNSAGNEGSNTATTISAPADAEGILAVGAVSKDLTKSSFSSVGPTADGRIKPDVVALGRGVRLWQGSNSTSTASGTSFSAPQIAALAAGLWQGRPEWTKDQLIHYILQSSSQHKDPDDQLGYGIPDFELAYYGEILDVVGQPENTTTKIYPNPSDGTELFIQFGNKKECDFTLINKNGQIINQNTLTRTSNEEPYELEINAVHSGLYVVQLQEGVNLERHKVIIQ
ncbi:peptidase [Echinicola strongylocentroti]|uniref:Peptidase n=1 Tax=Echinicola strongylocentroti TaxID=1795355 RepID=A0A2Z4IDU7_9BACT|nr:S8 family serine peptidase [Echinicola strongylocentroti]AWW28668.1 peptidase [Echinicola strongylocentroti]